MLAIRETEKSFYRKVGKRLIDLSFGGILLFLSLPIMSLIAILIKVFDGGCVIYKQRRLGLEGKEFILYKFRTMKVNGEKELKEFLERNPEAAKEYKKYKKIKGNDPRVTTVGKFLRKFSLDELPQLFNVLKGDMSLVGPRPYLKEELFSSEVNGEEREKILSVKPGITGLWQVSGRNELTFKERIRIDLKYVEKVSLKEDFKILLKTLFVVLKGKGAY
ncbi:lipopolysaccharide/colanic/teichoic acid biosynthesis glycosyltransferase [Thermovibrio guaymasensis]|uniref:Lipopolysaccharide/colanic/teichoic acid biosynthesis glycosyltransferase n=1 Tax=Thermovibrio guaymasensis TaxID=240167 RepID=A0A420W635_9BACT|nr:sugar transferase [Thermovibrio guaymasensis]RKQ60628.1 lipopolysaccharide/colanic/teichoic acid biosynthesis glycosyltransferase [Thermovibrio guaymasensis]